MLRVTKLTDYATVVLTVLATRPGDVLSATELADLARQRERLERKIGHYQVQRMLNFLDKIKTNGFNSMIYINL